jgi:hypothetical protein
VVTAEVTRTLEVPVMLAMLGEILEPVAVVEVLPLEAHLVVVVEVLLLLLEAHLELLSFPQEELPRPSH